MSFSREYRLVNKENFQIVFAKPKKITQTYLITLFRANSKTFPRLGMIISKRHIPKAVDRNLIKRLIRERFRARFIALRDDALRASPRGERLLTNNIDIIIMLRSKPPSLDKRELRRDIDRLLNSISNRQIHML